MEFSSLIVRYTDAAQYICKLLEARDVKSLAKTSKGIRGKILPLFAGATVGRQMDKTGVNNVISIPLLDIRESFPIYIIRNNEGYYISRVSYDRGLKAQTIYIRHGASRIILYVVNNYVKHYILIPGQSIISACTPTKLLSLNTVFASPKIIYNLHNYDPELLFDVIGYDTYKRPSLSQLRRELQYTFRDTSILLTREFLKFIVCLRD